MGKKNETTKQPETLEEFKAAYAAAQEQIEELTEMVSELNTKLTAVEKAPKGKGVKLNPTVSVGKKTYEVLTGCIHKAVRYTKEALAENKELCAELIEEELSEGILKLKEEK